MSPDPVSGVAAGGWASAWLAPAAGGEETGVLVGLEHSGFAAVTSAFAAVRFRKILMWQIAAAQTSVRDLFDDALLAEFPELSTLGASATQLGLDGVMQLGSRAAFGLGVQYERDQFLGDGSSAWLARVSGAGPTLLGIRSAVAFERLVSGGGAPAGAGRLRAGVARELRGGRLMATVGLGGTWGDVWQVGSRQRRIGSFLRMELFDVLSLSGSLGTERDSFGDRGWLGYWAFGLGLSVGPVGAHVRRGGPGSADAAPNAVSIIFAPQSR